MNLGVYVVKVHIYMNEDEKFYDANKAGKFSQKTRQWRKDLEMVREQVNGVFRRITPGS
jgi:uncharacterized membrane protein